MSKTLQERCNELSDAERARVDAYEQKLLAEVRAYRLREVREQQMLSQADVAERSHVSQRRISSIESGDIETTQVDTLRRYAEAVGGTLRVEIDLGGESFRVA